MFWLLAALVGWLALAAGMRATAATHAYSVSTNAKVISSGVIWDQGDSMTWLRVRFKPKSGQPVSTTVWPINGNRPAHGQKVPIHYKPNAPSHALYVGPWGDENMPRQATAYFFAVVFFGLAATVLFSTAWRLTRVMQASIADKTSAVGLRAFDEVVRTDQLRDGYSLEWRVLDDDLPERLKTVDDVAIVGMPAGGRWLVVRLSDGRLVWPASKAEPVLESVAPRLPTVEPGPVGAVHLLLAGYAQIIGLLGAMPLIIRRRPWPKIGWWVLGGVPRPVVKALVTLHLRRRLAALGTALLRASLLCDDERDSHSRRMFAEASDECQALARTLPRRGFLVVVATLATIAATSMSILSPFLALPQFPLRGHTISQHALQVLIGILIFAILPLRIFFRSVRYKRALFSPASASSDQPVTESDRDVYKLERAAFTEVALPEPNEWESRPGILWLIGASYLAIIAIPLGYAYTVLTFSILGGSVALFALAMACWWLRRIRAP